MIKIESLTPEEEKKRQEVYKKNWQKLMSREAYVYDQGHEQGVEQNKLDTAKRLLTMGLSIEDVVKGADLDYSIVHKLA